MLSFPRGPVDRQVPAEDRRNGFRAALPNAEPTQSSPPLARDDATSARASGRCPWVPGSPRAPAGGVTILTRQAPIALRSTAWPLPVAEFLGGAGCAQDQHSGRTLLGQVQHPPSVTRFGAAFTRLDVGQSKTCHVCKAINTGLKLSDRSWECVCGVVHDRDLNAAVNLELLAGSSPVSACGDDVSPGPVLAVVCEAGSDAVTFDPVS